MKIKKGQRLHVVHTRKGEFDAVAIEDFDTETRTFYPVALAKHNPVVEGLNSNWEPGEEIPCRDSLCTITIVENESDAKQ